MKKRNQNEISDAVDTLMNDMTVGTRRRRDRDIKELDKIREKQGNKNHGISIFKGVKTAVLKLTHKNIDNDMNATEKWEGSPSRKAGIQSLKGVQETDYEQTVVMEEDDDGEKTVVMEENEDILCILYFRENETMRRIDITTKNTIIGSQEGLSDAVVQNRRISRRHAELIFDDGDMYIKDMRSTNGTYINDSNERIVPLVEYRLHNGDRFRLADTEFEVEIK